MNSFDLKGIPEQAQGGPLEQKSQRSDKAAVRAHAAFAEVLNPAMLTMPQGQAVFSLSAPASQFHAQSSMAAEANATPPSMAFQILSTHDFSLRHEAVSSWQTVPLHESGKKSSASDSRFDARQAPELTQKSFAAKAMSGASQSHSAAACNPLTAVDSTTSSQGTSEPLPFAAAKVAQNTIEGDNTMGIASRSPGIGGSAGSASLESEPFPEIREALAEAEPEDASLDTDLQSELQNGLAAGGGPGGRSGAGAAGAAGSGSGAGASRTPAFFILSKAAVGRSQKTQKGAAQARAKTAAPIATRPENLTTTALDGEASVTSTEKLQPGSVRGTAEKQEALPRPATASHLKLQYIQSIKDLADKIQARAKLFKQGGETLMEVRLSPPRLGGLRVQIDVQGDEMRLHFTAQREAAIPLLQEVRAELSNIAADQGYSLTRCDVEYQAFPDRWHDAQQTYSANKQNHPQQATGEQSASDEDSMDRQTDNQFHALDLGYNTLDLVA